MADRNEISGGTFFGPVAQGSGASATQHEAPLERRAPGTGRVEPPPEPVHHPDRPFVMVSYASTDHAVVDNLCAWLAGNGVVAWIDRNVGVGDRWTRELARRVEHCSALIPVMTPEAERSAWVERELDHRERLEGVVLPLLFRGLPFFRLAHLQYDTLRPDGTSSSEFLRRVLALVADRPSAS